MKYALIRLFIRSALRYLRLRMVDIHCHILPGLDDGPSSLETSLDMAEMAISEGITHIIATPHANDAYPFVPELVRARRDEIQARLSRHLQIAAGCDFHLSYENLMKIRQNPRQYTLNESDYLLVEFADYSVPHAIDQTLHRLQLAGLHPVITHPERNPLIRSQPERLIAWVERGCFAQVTAMSFTGGFGSKAKSAAETWLDARAIHFVASDAHNLVGRPPRLREAYDVVAKRSGEHVARALFRENPLAVFEGRPLPYLPEISPLAFRPSAAFRPARHRKRFWFF